MLVRTIGELIHHQTLVTIEADATVADASAKMAAYGVTALIVADGAQMSGILCQSDVIERCLDTGARPEETRVADITTPRPVTMDLQKSLSEAVRVMMQYDFSHLPVVEPGGEVVGVVTLQDIPLEYRQMVERFSAYRALHTAA